MVLFAVDQTMAFASRNVKSPCKDGGPSLKKLYQDFGFVTSARGKSFSVFPTSVVRRVRENNSVLAPSSGYYKTSFSIEYAPQWEERRRKAAMPSSW